MVIRWIGGALLLGLAMTEPGSAADCPDPQSLLKDARALVGCISSLNADVTLMRKLLEEARSEVKELRYFSNIPRDAVIAFDTPRGCPPGWSRFEQADGRFVLGVNDEKPRDDGPRARSILYRTTGGEEMVTLTPEQMPVHKHRGPAAYVGAARTGRGDGAYGNASGDTTNAGGSRPHNNMPPYVALYFCKKD